MGENIKPDYLVSIKSVDKEWPALVEVISPLKSLRNILKIECDKNESSEFLLNISLGTFEESKRKINSFYKGLNDS